MRSPVRLYCLGGCSALLVCAQRSPQVRRAGPVPLLVAPSPLLSLPRLPRSACGGLPRPGVPCSRLLVRDFMWSVRSLSSVRWPFWCSLYVCVLAHPRWSGLPPSCCCLGRALREVPSQDAHRAVRGGSCPSAFSARVPCSACRGLGGRAARPSRLPSGSPVVFRGVRVWALSLPGPFVLGARGRGPLPLFPRARKLRAWRPVTIPTTHALACRRCAPWRRLEVVLGGALCRREGCPRASTLPARTVRAWGVRPGPVTSPTTHALA